MKLTRSTISIVLTFMIAACGGDSLEEGGATGSGSGIGDDGGSSTDGDDGGSDGTGDSGASGGDGTGDSSDSGSSDTGGSGNSGSTSSGDSGQTSTDSTSTGPTVECSDASDCDDGTFCNGAELCVNDKCEPGINPCNDGVSCTVDTCEESSDTCTNTPDDAICDDGKYCTGFETCDATNDCQYPNEPPINCNESDSYACTVPTCDNETEGCIEVPTDGECDDGAYCNGVETCNPEDGTADSDGCVPDTEFSCDDQLDCTEDACNETDDVCEHDADHSYCNGGSCSEGSSPDICDPNATAPGTGCVGPEVYCTETLCPGVQNAYKCGDCIDNDGDCLVDHLDPDCLGPCDNNETGWFTDVSGADGGGQCPTRDCYFDDNSGTGNDNCYWHHSCDPLEPEGCPCTQPEDSTATSYSGTDSPCETPSLGGEASDKTCTELYNNQDYGLDPDCNTTCEPMVPNGCDCWGCCDVTLSDDSVITVFIGTKGEDGKTGTCNLEAMDNWDGMGDPPCDPCTQVPSCGNSCEECEICLGKDADDLPEHCDGQQCPEGVQACGEADQDPCPSTHACITGCCIPLPQ